MDGKKLALWALYNFGGAIAQVVFILYFSQWLVVERGLPDIYFNATLVISSFLLLIATPLTSLWGDGAGSRIPGLRLATFGAVACFAAVGIITTLAPSIALLAAAFFTGGLVCYLFGGIFWLALLPDIAHKEQYGRTGGWGQVGDWLGEMFGIVITLPLVGGALVLFGAPGRAQAFLPASLLYLLFSLPMLLLYRESGVRKRARISIRQHYSEAIHNFVDLCRMRGLGWFFLAFFFFNDAIITAADNFPIYLERVFGVSDTQKSLLLLGILLTAAAGSLLGGRLIDRIGTNRTLALNLLGWIVLLPLMGATRSFPIFVLETLVMGLWFGAIWVIARAIIASLSPQETLNRAFSYYTLMERFATLVGPLSWSLIVALVPHEGALNYRVAIALMTIFVAVGFFFARKIPQGAGHVSLV